MCYQSQNSNLNIYLLFVEVEPITFIIALVYVFSMNWYISIIYEYYIPFLLSFIFLYILFYFWQNKIMRYENDEVSENIKQIMECNIRNIRFL